jgi:hypothetical protein
MKTRLIVLIFLYSGLLFGQKIELSVQHDDHYMLIHVLQGGRNVGSFGSTHHAPYKPALVEQKEPVAFKLEKIQSDGAGVTEATTVEGLPSSNFLVATLLVVKALDFYTGTISFEAKPLPQEKASVPLESKL